jgi:hypothetical protein
MFENRENSCHCPLKEQPHQAKGLIRLFQRKKLRIRTYDVFNWKMGQTPHFNWFYSKLLKTVWWLSNRAFSQHFDKMIFEE